MRKMNVRSQPLAFDATDPVGYRCAAVRVGELLGSARTGISIYEIPAGQSICPYHYECAEEEWLLVLDGAPTLRHPEGEDVLEPWDVVLFPVGPDGAHKVTNSTDATVRVMMFSDLVVPAVTVYPDSDKVGVWPGAGTEKLIVRRSDGVGYWDGEAAQPPSALD